MFMQVKSKWRYQFIDLNIAFQSRCQWRYLLLQLSNWRQCLGSSVWWLLQEHGYWRKAEKKCYDCLIKEGKQEKRQKICWKKEQNIRSTNKAEGTCKHCAMYKGNVSGVRIECIHWNPDVLISWFLKPPDNSSQKLFPLDLSDASMRHITDLYTAIQKSHVFNISHLSSVYSHVNVQCRFIWIESSQNFFYKSKCGRKTEHMSDSYVTCGGTVTCIFTVVMNRLFSVNEPLSQSESWYPSFHMKMRYHSDTCKLNSYEKLFTRPHFDGVSGQLRNGLLNSQIRLVIIFIS